jgi:hypothetical protein
MSSTSQVCAYIEGINTISTACSLDGAALYVAKTIIHAFERQESLIYIGELELWVVIFMDSMRNRAIPFIQCNAKSNKVRWGFVFKSDNANWKQGPAYFEGLINIEGLKNSPFYRQGLSAFLKLKEMKEKLFKVKEEQLILERKRGSLDREISDFIRPLIIHI